TTGPWPTYSASVRGRSDWSKPASSAAARPDTRRGPSISGSPGGQRAQRAPQQVLESGVAVLAQRAVDAALRFDARVAEVHERRQQVVARAAGRVGGGRVGRRGARGHLVLELE